jgi:hypothetical protein
VTRVLGVRILQFCQTLTLFLGGCSIGRCAKWERSVNLKLEGNEATRDIG